MEFQGRELNQFTIFFESETKQPLIISAIFSVIYILYFVAMFFVVRWCEYDVVYGFMKKLRERKVSADKIQTLSILFLISILLVPFIIAAIWAFMLYQKIDDKLDVVVVILLPIFTTTSLLGFSQWYGAKWDISRTIKVFFSIAGLIGFTFALSVTLIPRFFSFSGATAILFSTNFLPACYLVHQKTQWQDINLRHMFYSIAARLASKKPDENEDPQAAAEEEKEAFTALLGKNAQISNEYLIFQVIMSAVFYLVPLVVYSVVLLYNLESKEKGMAIATPLFIICSDAVILSLRDQHVSTKSKSYGQFIYTTVYQSLHLLVIRVILCFMPKYWLIMQSIAFLMSAFVIGFDLSEAIMKTSGTIRDEQTDIIELYRVVPLLQAKVGTQCPELRTQFDKEDTKTTCIQLFGTQVAALLFFVVFGLINYVASIEPDYLKTDQVQYEEKHGQWIFGVLSIGFSIVMILFIWWFRQFKLANYRFTWKTVLLIVIIQVVSTVFGFLFHYAYSVEVYQVVVSFVTVPIMAGTFLGYYGVWASNDYNTYERSFKQSQNFNVLTMKEYKDLPIWDRIQKVDWKPKTYKDCLAVSLLVCNVLAVLVYSWGTAALLEPFEFGLTIGTIISLLELSILFLTKYKESNYIFGFSVSAYLFLIIVVYAVWTPLVNWTVLSEENEAEYSTGMKYAFKLFVIEFGFFYPVVILVLMLYYQINEVGVQFKKLTKSFYVVAVILFVGLVAACCYLFYDNLLDPTSKEINLETARLEWLVISVCCLAVVIYLVLSTLIKNQKARLVIDIIFCVLFVLAGIALMILDAKSQDSFEGKEEQTKQGSLTDGIALTCIFFGMFLLSFSAFFKKFQNNRQKKKTSILMHSARVFPILEYNMASRTMKTINSEAVLLFVFEFLVLLWGFCATCVLPLDYRYIPVSIMAVSLSVTFIYIINKNVGAFTVDFWAFKQATLLFYASCLVTATQNKKTWRNQSRGTKAIAVTENEDSSQQQPFGPVYQKELRAADQWRKAINDHKDLVGYFGFFTANQTTYSKYDVTAIEAAAEGENSQQQLIPDAENALKPEVDSHLDNLVTQFASEGDLDAKLGAFIDLILGARTEVLHDTKFWAFLNGYLHLRMQLLQEQQQSILQSAIEMFKNTRKGGEQQPKDKEDKDDNEEDHFSISSFLLELNKDTSMILDFSKFLADEIITDGKRRGTVKKDDDDDDEGIVPDYPSLDDVKGDGQAALDAFMQIQKQHFDEKKAQFDLEQFQQEQQALIAKLMKEKQKSMMDRIAEARKRDEERQRQRAMEEERNRIAQENAEKRKKINMDEVQEVGQEEDEKLLQQIGDQELAAQNQRGGAFNDHEFEREKALGSLGKRYVYTRAKDIESHYDGGRRAANGRVVTKVFADGVSAGDIKQGALGDCYLLSAMSVIAHSRPELLKKIFHPQSRQMRDDGLYTIMLYQARSPVVLTVDDRFLCNERSMRHAFVKLYAQDNGEREIWPLLIEKAYAKLYGDYAVIEGGLVDAALADLTNGAPQNFQFTDPKVKEWFNTGELWQKVQYWVEKGYLLGAGSPPGSDTDTSDLGIVQGHAYSILDVFEVDGNRLIQLRNPWGDETEWKGAWGDHSNKWTDKRKRKIYSRMESKSTDQQELGKDDGVFWMSFTDFFTHFNQLFLCRFFDSQEYKEIFFESEWSVAKNTAGGCTNNQTCGQNPQMKLFVESNNGQPIEVFMAMTVRANGRKKFGIGFEIYKMGGQSVRDRRIPNPAYDNDGGYCVTNTVEFDGKLAPTTDPYTLLMTAFEAGKEGSFRFTIWYKHSQGSVRVEKF